MICSDDMSLSFENHLIELCQNSPYGARIISYHTAYYGKKYDFLDFWIQKDISNHSVCAFCRYYSTLIICGDTKEKDELNTFIEMVSPEYIICDGKFDLDSRMFPIKITGDTLSCKKIYQPKRAEEDIHFYTAKGEMAELKKAYDILQSASEYKSVLPAFEDYFIDMSHRIRHGTSKLYLLNDSFGNSLSTASVLAVSDTSALIGSVATYPAKRCNGYAGMITAYAAQKEIMIGRQVYLHREKPIRMYERIGFVTIGEWAEYRKIKNIVNDKTI